MSDLIAWLRGQLDEDEAAARRASPILTNWEGVRFTTADRVEIAMPIHLRDHLARWDPAAVLADIAAKRAVLDLCAHWGDPDPDYESVAPCRLADDVAKALAQAYAGRAGFDPSWRTG